MLWRRYGDNSVLLGSRPSASGVLDPRPVGQSLHAKAYRADIDGLRAIAVTSVVVSHALPSVLPSGFVGVDVFFVISGYLISLILIGDLENERFSILKFYERRVRRIFPALITVFLFTWFVGWALLFRPEFQALGRHIVASTLFGENFLLWSESGYFDLESRQKPLLYLWSLAIEEQFYIFWPLLMFLSSRRYFPFLPMLGILAALSFGVNIYDISHDPAPAYYSPLGRFWELMVGAGLAWLTAKRPNLLGNFKSLQSVCGVFLLFLAFVFTTPNREFPGFWALLPTLGAFFIISAGDRAWFNKNVLSSRPFVWCGLISYPLYLWHWPLISYMYIVAGVVTPPKAISVIALSVVAAIATFLIVEKPFRVHGGRKRQMVGLIGTMVAVGLLGFATMWPLILPRLSSFKAPTRSEWDFLLQREARSNNNTIGVYRINGDRPALTMVIGDSHVAQYAERIDRTLKGSTTRGAVLAVGGGCVPIEGARSEMIQRHGCFAMRNEGLSMAMDSRFDRVVIGGSWNRLFTEDNDVDYFLVNGRKVYFDTLEGRRLAFDRLARQIQRFRGAGKQVFLVLDAPIAPDFSPRGLKARLSLSASNFTPDRFVSVSPDQIVLHEAMRALGVRTGATVIDPFSAFCVEDKCRATDASGLPIYKDATHFNPDWTIDNARFIDVTVQP